MKTKMLAALILCVALISSSCAKKSEPALGTVLRVGMECEYAPFNWTQFEESEFTVPIGGGAYADGYDVQIAKLIAEGLGLELEIVKTNWDGLSPSLTSNKIDLVIAGMTDNEERRATIDFTDVYWASDLVMVVRKDGPYANATSISEFVGATVTGQMGTIHYDMIDKIDGAIKQDAMEDFPTMLMALASGKIDAYVSERPPALAAELSNPELTFISFAADKGFGEEVPVSIGLRKGEDQLKADVNKILAEISSERRIQIMDAAGGRQPLVG